MNHLISTFLHLRQLIHEAIFQILRTNFKISLIIKNKKIKNWPPIYLGILTSSIPTLHSSNMNFGFNFGTQISYFKKKKKQLLPKFDAKASHQSCGWARN